MKLENNAENVRLFLEQYRKFAMFSYKNGARAFGFCGFYSRAFFVCVNAPLWYLMLHLSFSECICLFLLSRLGLLAGPPIGGLTFEITDNWEVAFYLAGKYFIFYIFLFHLFLTKPSKGYSVRQVIFHFTL